MAPERELPSRLPLVLGIVLLAAGWAVITLGWYQSGQQDLETGQIPYVISGGFGGFGLILMGVVLMLVDVVRQAETKLRHSAEALHERLEELAETFVLEQAPTREAPPARRAGPKRKRSESR